MREDRRSAGTDSAEDTATTGLAVGDRLLLVFAELAMYGIAAEDDIRTEPEQARVELAALLRMRAPHGLGSYVFRLRAEGGLDAVTLYTSGPEVDRAVAAACAHHGLAVRPGPQAGVLLAQNGVAPTARSSQTRSSSGMPSTTIPGG
jgi:hypothetical protein